MFNFSPKSQYDLNEIIDEAIRKSSQSGLNREEKFKNFILDCVSRIVKIFADFDNAGRISVYLSNENLEK